MFPLCKSLVFQGKKEFEDMSLLFKFGNFKNLAFKKA